MITTNARDIATNEMSRKKSFEQQYNKIIDLSMNKLSEDLIDVFRYYGIPYNNDDISKNIESTLLPQLKDKRYYLKICNSHVDAINSCMDADNKLTTMIINSSKTSQESLLNNINFDEAFNRFKQNINSVLFNKNQQEEINKAIEKCKQNIENQVRELLRALVNDNKMTLEKMTNTKIDSIDQTNIQVFNMPDKDAITYLENKFSTMDDISVMEEINTLEKSIPFGKNEIENYLKQKKQEISNKLVSVNQI